MENNIGEARRQYASEVGKFTQEDAARFFGVSVSTYKKWEQGQGMMNGAQLRAIAEKYRVTVDYLLQAERPKPQPSLTPEESALLALYLQMDGQAKARVMEYAAFQADAHPLNQGLRVAESA